MGRGWYSRKIFPRLLDWSMAQAAFGPLRESLLSQASGAVLEIGFGTGANLQFYPSHIRSLTAIDPNTGMIPFAHLHVKAGSLPVDLTIGSAECLPFPSASFDTIVSTMTLCSVPGLSQTLLDMFRVVKPGGRFLFLEHGQSPDPPVRRWQDRLTPIWKHLGDGCHLNRPMADAIQAHSWKIQTLERFYLRRIPKPFAYFYQGVAAKL
ncbi:MAG: class I SAM-dependent methyltransferase [Nitrospirales bacterium]